MDLRNPLAVKVVIFPRFELEVEFPLALFVIRNSLGNESDVLSWAYAAPKLKLGTDKTSTILRKATVIAVAISLLPM